MAPFPIDFSYLVGSWCAAVLWGAFGVLFALCVWLSFKNNRVNRIQLLAIVVLYVLGTGEVVLDFARLIQGFQFTPNGMERIMFFANVSLPTNVAKDFIYITMLWISDAVLIWRCWIVWNRDWLVIIVPTLLLLAEAAVGYAAIIKYILPNPANDATIKPLGTAMFALSLAANILVSGLIAGRLWWFSHRASKMVDGKHATRDALRLVIESGLAITTAKMIEVICYQLAFATEAEVAAIYTVFEAMPQIFGIIPTMILLSIQLKVIPTETATPSGSTLCNPSLMNGSLPLFKKNSIRPSLASSGIPTFSVETVITTSKRSSRASTAGEAVLEEPDLEATGVEMVPGGSGSDRTAV